MTIGQNGQAAEIGQNGRRATRNAVSRPPAARLRSVLCASLSLLRVLLLLLLLAACSSSDQARPSAEATRAPGLNGTSPALTMSEVTPTAEGQPAPIVGSSPGWVERSPMITARSEMPAAPIGGLIYVPGGFGPSGDPQQARALEVYDPAADRWEGRAPMPADRHHLMAAAHGGRLYAFGGACQSGCGASATTWAYDPAADRWEERAPMPEERVAGAAVTLGESIYIVGGTGPSGALLRYDPASDRWSVLASLAERREHLPAVAFDGKLYALGGRWAGGELSSVEIYDPAADRWSSGPALLRPRGGHAAAVVAARIYVLGGEVLAVQPPLALNSVEVYDATAGGWTPGPELPATLHGLPALALEQDLYLIGGSDQAAAADNRGRLLMLRL